LCLLWQLSFDIYPQVYIGAVLGEEHPGQKSLLPFAPLTDRAHPMPYFPPLSVTSPINDTLVVIPDSVWHSGKVLLSLKAGGVSQYDSSRAQNGLTLLDQQSNSVLVDMNGKVWAKFPFGLTHILADGTIICARPPAVIKIDADLSSVWQTWASPHHEVTTDENGNVYVLSHELHEFMGLNVDFDMLKIFSADGDLIYEWRVFVPLEEFISIISKSP